MITLKKLSQTERIQLVDSAAGRRKVDTLITNVTLCNVFTGEMYPAVIGITNGYIAFAFEAENAAEYVDLAVEVVDGEGLTALPGFIDSHVHIESSMLTPQYFAELVIPHGTTTIVTDPHEIGNVLGIEGVEFMVESGKQTPMYQLALAPSCVPAGPGLEESGAYFGRKEIEHLLENERIIGIAEVMDFIGTIQNDKRMREIIDLGLEKDSFIQGHFFGNCGRDLAAYLCAGPSSNHEIFSAEDAREAVRAGMIVDARDSSFSRDIEAISSSVKQFGRIPNFTLCTDDREPAEILHKGHINDCIRSAIASGLETIQAVRAATINPAMQYGLNKLGAIAPGYIANLNLVDSLESMQVKQVFFEGQKIAENGEMRSSIEKTTFALEQRNSVHLGPIDENNFRIKAPMENGKAVIRVIHYIDRIKPLTEVKEREVMVKDGYVTLEGNEDLNFITVVNRHPGKTGFMTALVGNFQLETGALAGTVSHDSHNLTLVYNNPADALRVALKVAEIKGGVVYTDGEKEYVLNLPVAGLMTNSSAQVCIEQVDALNTVLGQVGIESTNPVMRLATAALPVVPHVKITDKGLVDVDNVTFIDLFVSGSDE